MSNVVGEERMMREQVKARLEALKKELETGQAELQKVEMQQTYLRETMFRISGAMQVLEELLTAVDSAKRDGEVTHEGRSASAQVRQSGT